MTERRWLTQPRRGDYLHLHPKSVYRACLARKLPHAKIPGVGVRIDKRELDACWNERASGPPSTVSGSRTDMDLGRYLSIEQAAQYTAALRFLPSKLTSRRRIPFIKARRRCSLRPRVVGQSGCPGGRCCREIGE